MACGVEQSRLESFGRGLRELLQHLGFLPRIELFVDTIERISDLGGLADPYDAVVFRRERAGLGVARSLALREALLQKEDFLLIVDGDGQYDHLNLQPLLETMLLPEFDIVYPIRIERHLPLSKFQDKSSGLNRLIAEHFQNYAIANMAAKPDYCWADLQPGAFGMNLNVVKSLIPKVKSSDFGWDLEFSFHILRSSFQIGQVSLKTKRQIESLFELSDFQKIIGYLKNGFGAEEITDQMNLFANEVKVQEEFAPEEIARLKLLVSTC